MNTTITLNGRTLLDDPLEKWQKRPPEQLAAMLQPDTNPPPWIKAAMITLADAALRQQPIHITITTTSADSWAIVVKPQ
jgi:hypothetical protein